MIFRPLTKALLMLMLLLSGILLLSACGGESDGRAVVYVNGEAGADTNAGTKGAPVATLECAFSKLEAGGTAVISGKTTVDASLSLADNTETVSVTSLFGGTDYRELGAQLCVNADMTFGGGVFFDDVTLLIGESGLTFAGGYGDIGFGAGVVCEATGASIRMPVVVGGQNEPKTVEAASSDKSYTVYVGGGTFSGLSGGNRRGLSSARGLLSGDIAVIIEGGTFTGQHGQSVSLAGSSFHSGNLYMEISGGTFSGSVYAYRAMGSLPIDRTLAPDGAHTGRAVLRILGGSFEKPIYTADDAVREIKNYSDLTIVLTGGEFASGVQFFNRGMLGSVLLRYDADRFGDTIDKLLGSTFALSADTEIARTETVEASFSGALSTRPDPWIVEKDGVYYYCYAEAVSGLAGITVAANGGIVMGDLDASAVSVFNASMTDISNAKHEYWAPELHYFDADTVGGADAGWYIYVAADNGDNENHRMYVLRSTDPEDPQSTYKMIGELETDGDRWAIDGTVLVLDGKLYFVWSGWAGSTNVSQDIYIQEMENPYTMKSGARTLLSKPQFSWETEGNPDVNEGPQALILDGTVHIIYSASGSWTRNYCLGALTLTGDDPLSAQSWTKSTAPLFRESEANSMYGTGHCSFVTDAAGDWMIYYHANKSLTVPEGSSWWTERDTYAQRFGTVQKEIGGRMYTFPDFGEPCPADALRAVSVRAADYEPQGTHLYATRPSRGGSCDRYCCICGVSAE